MAQPVTDFGELEVCREARALAQEVFSLSEAFPGTERYALAQQLRRSARSIGAQIAEAWAKRRYPRHFVSKLSDADAEQLETRHWLNLAVDLGYVGPQDAGRLLARLDRIGRMLNGMMRKAGRFRTHR